METMDALSDFNAVDGSIDGLTSFLKLWVHRNCTMLRFDGSAQDMAVFDNIERALGFLTSIWRAQGVDTSKNLDDFKATIPSIFLKEQICPTSISPAMSKLSSTDVPTEISEKSEANRNNRFLQLPTEILSTIFYDALHVDGVRGHRYMSPWLCICKSLFPIVMRELSANPMTIYDRRSICAFLRMLTRVKLEDIRHLVIRASPKDVFDHTSVLKIVGLCSRITTLSLNPNVYDIPVNDKPHAYLDVLEALRPVKDRIRTLYIHDDTTPVFWTALKTFQRISQLGVLGRYPDTNVGLGHLGSQHYGYGFKEFEVTDEDLSQMLPSRLTKLTMAGTISAFLRVLKRAQQTDAPFPGLQSLDIDFGNDTGLMYYIFEAISSTVQHLSFFCDNRSDKDEASERFYAILGKCTNLTFFRLKGMRLLPWKPDSAGLFQPSLEQLSLHHCSGDGMDWSLWKMPLKASKITLLKLDLDSYNVSKSHTEKWSSTRASIIKYCRGKDINLILPKKG
ncbi:hypothetical protein BT69DRAFT_1352006 [Atractiella rhizophila]|nr:hypothetical protein BT69DRAFT_1352006 [Atractiella rhizophila]